MSTSILKRGIPAIALAGLLFLGTRATAQSADESFKAIPQNVKQSGENKAVAKTNTVSNKVADQLDSASGKVFKGFTHLFKKKPKAPPKDSTGVHKTDTTVVPAKTTSWIGDKFSRGYVSAFPDGPADTEGGQAGRMVSIITEDRSKNYKI